MHLRGTIDPGVEVHTRPLLISPLLLEHPLLTKLVVVVRIPGLMVRVMRQLP